MPTATALATAVATATRPPTLSVPHPTFSAHTAGATATPPLPISSNGAIFSSPRYSYTVVLPCCWMALPMPSTAIGTAQAQAQAKNEIPLWGDLSKEMPANSGGAALELIALLPDKKNVALPQAQMTVSVLPAHGLTVEKYLTATSKELNNIANTLVLTTTIDTRLGVGGLPAAVIEYESKPAPPATAKTGKTIAGLQVAFYGQDAETLIVLTFTTTIERYHELKAEFLHIVRSVTLNRPSA